MKPDEVIAEIQRLSNQKVAEVYQYIFSTESELDRLLTAFDRLPRQNRLTERRNSRSPTCAECSTVTSGLPF
ncbi:MAG: hypothetical protein ABI042_09075 [Verrucomicrobiota bacterium]